MRILHTMLRVGDLDRSIKFYTEVLGMRLLRRKDYPDGKFTLAFIGYGDEAENTVIELTYNWDTDSYDLGSGYGHIALEVDDVAQTVARADGLALAPVAPSLTPGVDARYSAAPHFFSGRGYQRIGEACNMTVDLAERDFGTGDAERVLRSRGICFRRARDGDRAGLTALLQAHWPAWLPEVRAALNDQGKGGGDARRPRGDGVGGELGERGDDGNREYMVASESVALDALQLAVSEPYVQQLVNLNFNSGALHIDGKLRASVDEPLAFAGELAGLPGKAALARAHEVLYYENTEGGHGSGVTPEQRARMMAVMYTYLWSQLRKTLECFRFSNQPAGNGREKICPGSG